MPSTIKYMVNTPNAGDAGALVDLAVLAEEAGWDGFALWDHLQLIPALGLDLFDPYTVLGAVAVRTSRLAIGTLVTPVARRQPWELAKQAVTLDHLSGGRSFVGVGLGEPPDADFEAFGLPSSPVERGVRLDEGLAIVDAVLRGDGVAHAGPTWSVTARLRPAAVQRPRPPVWVAGLWPNRRPLRRAARYDAYYPIAKEDRPLTPDDVAEAVRRLADEGAAIGHGFDVAVSLLPDGPSSAEYADAGATWVVESAWPPIDGWFADLRARVAAGPDRA